MKAYLNNFRISTEYLAAVYLISSEDHLFQKLEDIALIKNHLDELELNAVEYTIARLDEGIWARKHNLMFSITRAFGNNPKVALDKANQETSTFNVCYVCFEDKESLDRNLIEFGININDKLRLVILPINGSRIDRDSSRSIGPGQYVYDCSSDGVLNILGTYPRHAIPDCQVAIEKVHFKTKQHPKLKLQILPGETCKHPLPTYATSLSSGFDLHACYEENHTHILFPGDTSLIPTNLKVIIPVGYELQIRSRSGLALKNGIVVANSPATIDADYAGNLGIILHNQSKEAFHVTEGMRIAQAVLCPVVQAEFETITKGQHDFHFMNADRKGGFGSTGL